MNPRMTAILKIFEPTTLPTLMPGAPLSVAETLAPSSGLDVPKPTMVSPTNKGDTPRRNANALAPRTSNSAPAVITTAETITSKMVPTFIPAGRFPDFQGG